MIKAVYQTANIICGGWNLHKTCIEVVLALCMRLMPDLNHYWIN